MAQSKFTNTAGGDFANAGNWSAGVPGAADDALLTTVGTYTVTSSGNQTVNSLQMIATVTFEITGGSFQMTNGSGSGTDAGLIQVDSGATLVAGGTISGPGTITLNSYYQSALYLSSATTTLSGGGKVIMSDSGANLLQAGTAGYVLNNVNDTISGGGMVGNGVTGLINGAAGVINATAAVNQLVLNFGTYAASNAGLIEATGTAGLAINASTIANTGTLKAVASALTLNSTIINGGKLASSAGGTIQSVNASLNGVTILAGSTVVAGSGNTLYLGNTLTNAGTVQVNSYYQSQIILNTPTVTLSGAGQILMDDSSANRIFAATPGGKLVNNQTIAGGGQLGVDQTAFTNAATGVVNGSAAVNALVLDFGTYAASNAGLLEATGTGGLVIQNTILTNTTGHITAAAAGANVSINNSVVNGGTLASVSGAAIYSGGAVLNGVTLTAASNLIVSSSNTMTLDNSFINNGTLQINAYYQSDLVAATGTVTLTGGGTIAFDDSQANRLYGTVASNVIVNVNNTLVGSAQIGAGQATIDNQALGTIKSNGAAGMTIFATGFTNEGLIEDTGPGGINIYATTIVNAGTIAALGTLTHVDLSSGSDIVGGTLKTAGAGVIQSLNNGTLDGSTATGALTIAAGSTVQIISGATLAAAGTIVNVGTIAMNAYYQSDLYAASPVLTLTGGGTIAFDDSLANRIYGGLATDKIINVNNIWVGSAQIGAGQGTIDNQAAGIIDSSGSAGMTLDANAFSNEGLIEATGTGGLALSATLFVNTGTIAAYGLGDNVTLDNGAIIRGGVLTSSGGGVFAVSSGGTLDGGTATGAVTIAAGTAFEVNSSQTLDLQGSIVNKGTIALAAYYQSDLVVNSATVTLSGGGTIGLSDTNANRIYGAVTTDKLVNTADSIIGAGQLGAGQLTLDNQKAGVIEQLGATALTINLNSAFTNEGIVEAGGPGGLLIQNATLTNTGIIESLSASTATIDASTIVTNYAAGTLTGGTWEAIAASGTTSTLSIAAGTIAVDAAKLVLSGAGASIVAGGTSVAATLKTITSKGELDIQNGASVTLANTLTNSGKIVLAGTLAAPALSNTATGTITGSGGLASITTTGKFANAGLLQATAGTVQLTKGTVSNTGSILAQAGAKLVLTTAEKNTNLVAGTLTGGTWGAIGAGATLSVQDGTIGIDAATLTLSGAGSVITSTKTNLTLETTLGTIAAGGILNVLNGRGFATGVAGGLSDAGTINLGGGSFGGPVTIGAGGVFDGTGTITGGVTDNGALFSNAAIAGGTGTLVLTSAVAGTGTLEAGAATTLSTAGYSIGALTIDAGGTLSGAGSVSGAVSDAGALVLAGGTLAAGSITVAAGATLSGFGTVGSAVADGGVVTARGGTLVLAGASGAGSASIASGATLQSTTALTVAGVGFTGTAETLALGTAAGNTAVISGFGNADTIDLLSTVATSFTYNATTGTLVLKNGSTTLGALKFAGSYAKTNFSLGPDGHGGTDILFVPSALADLQNAAGSSTAASAPPAPAAQLGLHPAPALGFSPHHDTTIHAEGLFPHLGAAQ